MAYRMLSAALICTLSASAAHAAVQIVSVRDGRTREGGKATIKLRGLAAEVTAAKQTLTRLATVPKPGFRATGFDDAPKFSENKLTATHTVVLLGDTTATNNAIREVGTMDGPVSLRPVMLLKVDSATRRVRPGLFGSNVSHATIKLTGSGASEGADQLMRYATQLGGLDSARVSRNPITGNFTVRAKLVGEAGNGAGALIDAAHALANDGAPKQRDLMLPVLTKELAKSIRKMN